MTVSPDEVGRIFQRESGRCVATLIRHFGDIDVAEEAVQDAFLVALQRWPVSGLPANAGAWITQTAKHRAVDQYRRESKRQEKQATAAFLQEGDAPPALDEDLAVRDDRLRLIFTCCHPALARSAQVALTLRLLGGLETSAIARAFLVPEVTMAQRLVRAKHKIKAAGIPYEVPAEDDLRDRLRAVLAVVYLVFNEGHIASSGDDLVRQDLCEEAIRLARVLAELLPEEPEVLGLLALLLLVDARRDARTADDGALVLLADQDRSRWNAARIAEGLGIVRVCLRVNRPGPYQIQAAIQAVHADAATASATDWSQIVQLYDQLLVVSPTPVVALNRAVAVAELEGADAGLRLVDQLALATYPPFHATRAELLRREGRFDESASAYARAAELTENQEERRFFERRLREVAAHRPS